MKIRTSYDKPPIPTTARDWSAVTDGYDAGDPIGYGATEEEAMNDLREQLLEDAETVEEAMKLEALEAISRARRFPLRPEDADLLLWIVRGYFHEV